MKLLRDTVFLVPGIRKFALLAIAIAALASRADAASSVQIQLDRQIILPDISVSSSPQQVYTTPQVISLKNRNNSNGWVLTGAITDDAITGDFSGEQIPAAFMFTSVTWLSGGNGSAAGILIHPSGNTIEADPGFGIGDFEVEFLIRYDAPAYPIADQYRGVSTFIVQ